MPLGIELSTDDQEIPVCCLDLVVIADTASQERLQKLDRELANLKEQQSGLQARWQAEKADANRLGTMRDELDKLHGQLEQAKARYDWEQVGRLQNHEIPALERVGLAIAVADAVPDVKALAHVVTAAPGGHGAVRECVELILRAQGRWRATVEAYVREHGGATVIK